MRCFFCVLFLGCLVLCGAAKPAQGQPVRYGPWVTVGAVTALPLITYLSITYYELVWYVSYIIYTGKQASPIIARETVQYLDSYVRCIQMIRATQKELEVLIEKAESAVAGSGKEQTVRLIGGSIAAIFERELTDAQAYVDRVRKQLSELELTESYTAYSVRGGAVTYTLDLSRLRGFEHPDFSKADIDVLDKLIRDILDYWHTYLASLATAIDKRVLLCQKVHRLENIISGLLNRPLFPAFEQQIAPTPTVKEIFSEVI